MKHPDDILILFISQGIVAIIDQGINVREISVYLYSFFMAIAVNFTAIAAPFLFQPPLFPPTFRRRSKKRRSKREKRPAAIKEPGVEKALSLVLLATTSSQPPLARTQATPSLIVSETILGILFSFSSTSRIHNYLTFQVTVRTMQSSSKVPFKAESSPSNDTNKI